MASSLPTLLLERCAQAMERVIIPNLSDDFATMQAGLIATLLHILAPALEEKSKDLAEENDGMREVVEKVRNTLRRERVLSSNIVCHELLEELDRGLEKGEDERQDISGENQRLKGALVEAIKGLRSLKNDLSEETHVLLKDQIRRVIRLELDHALARVSGFDMKKIVERK